MRNVEESDNYDVPNLAVLNHEDSDSSGDEEEEEDMSPLVDPLLERIRH